jgi:hypothetical protein
VTFTLVFFHAPSAFKSALSISMMPQAVRYEGFSLPLSIATPCWMVLPEIRLTDIVFAMLFLTFQASVGIISPLPESRITSIGQAFTQTPQPAQSSALTSR